MTQNKTIPNTPIVWTLLGQKAGDNNQILALAESLGWGWTEKHMQYIALELITNRLLQVTLSGLKRKQCDELAAPWPDLVISAGRRNEPVARWIKKQSAGRCKLIHIGRPWANPRHFDLIITTPQYNLPKASNIIYNDLPLHRVNSKKLASARQQWQSKFAHLPRPWIALLIGGNSSTAQFTETRLRELAKSAAAFATTEKGALLVTTSARSPAGTITLMQKEISVPALYFDYSANTSANPYYAFLALADAFIVTAESISMLTESCATEKPVYLYDASGSQHQAIGTWLRDHFGPKRLRRDITRIHAQLIQRKRVSWLGDNSEHNTIAMGSQDMQNSILKVQTLFSRSPSPSGHAPDQQHAPPG